MAVPSSGQLRLRADIANEVNGSATGTNVSLRALSASAGKSVPDNMSEFYGYTAVEPPTIMSLYSSSTDTSVYARIRLGSTGGENPYSTGVYIGTSTNMTSNPKYELGAGSIYQYKGYNRTGLSPSTTYYWWGYATNSAGTTYTARQTRATGVAVSYSQFSGANYPNKPENYTYEAAGNNYMSNTFQYAHLYNGWTTFNQQTKSTTSAYPNNNQSNEQNMWGRPGGDTSNRTILTFTMGSPMWEPQPQVDVYMYPAYWYGAGQGWNYYGGKSNANKSYSYSGSSGAIDHYQFSTGFTYWIFANTPTSINVNSTVNQVMYDYNTM